MPSLPRYGDRFVGRADELAALASAVADARLITLTGPGGSGKTRLAVEAARRFARQRRSHDAVGFCTMAGARDMDAVRSALLTGLDVPADWWAAAPSPDARIARWLAERGPALFIVDNAETALSPLREMLPAWLDAADGHFVFTSREPLSLPPEQVLRVDSLTPGDAAILFATRTPPLVRVDPEADRATVGRIADLLDRMPLALELAAARLDVLSLAELETRLTEPFPVLRDPMGRPGNRHATVWRTIAWSWALLSPAERDVMVQQPEETEIGLLRGKPLH